MRKDEKLHIERVLSFGCMACAKLGYETMECEYHHIGNGTMGKRSDNYSGIGLCAAHHRLGGHGVAVHSGKKAWEANFGTEKELLNEVLEMINES